MKTATVADLRNNFAVVSKWIAEGESVAITKRGRMFATLAPARKKRAAPVPVDSMARLRRLFPEGAVSGNMQDVVEYDRGAT